MLICLCRWLILLPLITSFFVSVLFSPFSFVEKAHVLNFKFSKNSLPRYYNNFKILSIDEENLYLQLKFQSYTNFWDLRLIKERTKQNIPYQKGYILT